MAAKKIKTKANAGGAKPPANKRAREAAGTKRAAVAPAKKTALKSKAKPKAKAVRKSKPVKRARQGSRGGRIVFSESLGERICRHVCDGKTWRDVARLSGMPKERTIADWLCRNAGFAQQYARAREARAEVLLGEFEELRAELTTCTDTIRVYAVKVNLDALKWLMAKFYRRVYGDKLDVETTVTPAKGMYDYSRLSDAEMATMQRLLEKALWSDLRGDYGK